MPVSTIPPEIFPLIASFIPLRSAPQTLCTLALGNRRLYDIIRPILYSRVILQNEDDAITVIQQILDNPQLGMAVTELYILSDLSVDTRNGRKSFDVLAGLHMLINRRLIPRTVALGIYLSYGWLYDENMRPIQLGHLLADFWTDLRTACPRLRTLVLRNVGHISGDPWQSGPVIDEMNSLSDLSTLRLEWTPGDSEGLSDEDDLKNLYQLSRLSSTLHTLCLESQLQDATIILAFDFPHLEKLRLRRFESKNKTTKTMDFFRRHPQLQSLSLINCTGHWFSDEIDEGFLPNLKHLKARFDDIRILVPILPRLASLSFTESYNGQVPYLLRAVLPNGLPQLRSLEIDLGTPDHRGPRLEGASWYETLDGKFHLEKNRKKVAAIDFVNEYYMLSIIHGAPNLEELGLHGTPLNAESLATLHVSLTRLARLERFYYRGFKQSRPTTAEQWTGYEKGFLNFLSSAEALARVCACLTLVTNINGRYLPYACAKVERDTFGVVTGVSRRQGVGMLISADENDPFPSNP